MPGQSDVETALTQLAAAALYPDGTAAAPAIPATVRVYRGWPNSAALDADLAAGIVNVTIFPVPGDTRVTTRYAPDWVPDPVTPTLTVSVAGSMVTFAGSAGPGQLAGVLVDGVSYVHRTTVGDTPSLVAAVLATMINPIRSAIAKGPTLNLAGTITLIARTAADAEAALELRRQQQGFRMTAWCPTPGLRDATCDVLDIVFAAMPFLTLADGSVARLRYESTTTFDQRQDAALYRRDLVYTVEFATTQTAIQPSMLFGALDLGASVLIA